MKLSSSQVFLYISGLALSFLINLFTSDPVVSEIYNSNKVIAIWCGVVLVFFCITLTYRLTQTEKYSIESREIYFWQSNPSQLAYLPVYTILILGIIFFITLISKHQFISITCIILILLFIFQKYTEAKHTDYLLSHERLRVRIGGIFTGRKTFDCPMDEINSVTLNEPFFSQIFGIGNIEIGVDFSKTKIVLKGIKEPNKIREIIRAIAFKSVNMHTIMIRENPDIS
jgi:membrane protein YdbS with pleckstrin-like domain